MKVQCSGGTFELIHDGRTVFRGDSIALKDASGNTRVRKFREPDLCESENELCAELGGECGEAGLKITCGDGTAVIRLWAAIPEKEPVFGEQKYLAERGTAVALLKRREAGPCTAIYQHKEWWMRPSFCDTLDNVPEKTQLLLWKAGETYFALLAVCGTDCRADLCGADGAVALSLSTNCAGLRRCEDVAAVVSCGDDPYRCIREAVKTALKESGKPYPMRDEKRFPELFEFLGWCSWDAFGQDVSEADLMGKLEELREKEIPVQWVLIDDGWSQTDKKALRLLGLDADRTRFPNGFGDTVRRLKQQYGVRWVGVWQAVMGYWNGVDPDSDAFRSMHDDLDILPNGKILPGAEEARSFGFWNQWHRYLKRLGVDFVKVDSQSSISQFYRGRRTFGEASRGIHTGLEASAALNFDGALINCMGMAPEDIWNRPNTALSRNSDDFVPKVPHAIREHALQNAYNSLLHGNFYWEDWDMFWSGHEAAKQNAILRALSGGPIYLSEPTGQANTEFIFPLVMEDGKILRCRGVGLPTQDCLLRDPVHGDAPLKIFNHFREDCAVGVFHIGESEELREGSVGSADIPFLKGRSVWVYDWDGRSAALLRPAGRCSFRLKQDEAKLFLLLPVREGITVLGLLEKYLSFAAVNTTETHDDETIIEVEQGGTVGFLSQSEGISVMLDGIPLTPERRGNLYLVKCEEGRKHRVCVRIKVK